MRPALAICPECAAKSVEVEMKFDPNTKHFICRKCGLYATREQISDIKERLGQREKTREDKHYEYLEWWQKSKKDKQK
ncbi:MAG: hypothetical protein ACE5JT_02520 [Nitrosopumilaceae archaeon]